MNVEEDKNNIRDSITAKMEQLRLVIDADFIGLAIYDAMNNEIRWRLAVGATNARYKRIVIRLGKGIAGEVVQLNRTIKIENYPKDVLGDPIEYPILLVEHLKSVVAVPVADDVRIYGVLLVGDRNKRTYSNSEEIKAREVAQSIAMELAAGNIYKRIIHERQSIEDISMNEKINDSLFVRHLMERQRSLSLERKGNLHVEILDQSIVDIPEKIQKILIDSIETILNHTAKQEFDRVDIGIIREEGNLLIESKIYRPIPFAKQAFENIYINIGEIGGSILSYNEKDYLKFVMQIPVWSYSHPLF